MPLFSAFTPFGLLEFSGEPSEAERQYNALVEAYRDPASGQSTLDVAEGTHQEAKIYGWAIALACAKAMLQSVEREQRPETSYELLESHERRFESIPSATDSVVDRRQALDLRQRAARGPRFEAIREGLQAILGDKLVAYRPIAPSEAETYPASPADGPGVWRRADGVAKTVRLLSAVARAGRYRVRIDEFAAANYDGYLTNLHAGGFTFAGESFLGDGFEIDRVGFNIYKQGAPTGNIYARIFAHSGPFGAGGIPTGAALATSDPVDAATLFATPNLVTFSFSTPITLEPGTPYFVVLDYGFGSGANCVTLQGNGGSRTHAGNGARFNAGWADATMDFTFEVLTARRFVTELPYEPWSRSAVEGGLASGDLLAVDVGNWGLAERVTVLATRTEDGVRYFSARFEKPHEAGTYATTGPTPLWTSTKRMALVVVDDVTSIDPILVAKIDALFGRIMRAPTTWAIVQESSPGSGTVGPFVVGTTAGSKLGTAPVETITV